MVITSPSGGSGSGGASETSRMLVDDQNTPMSVGSKSQPVFFKDGIPVAGAKQILIDKPDLEVMNVGPTMGENTLYDIIYADDKFVTVGGLGSAYYIQQETDGTLTSAKVDGVWEYSNLNAIAYGNGIFVALGIYTAAYYSEDGINWTKGNDISANFKSIAYGNGRFVALTASGQAYYSTDGETWATGGTCGECDIIAFGNGKFVAIGYTTETYYSEDGETWTAGGTLTESIFVDIAYGNGMFVIGGYTDDHGVTYHSTDGITWEKGEDAGTRLLSTITYGGGIFVAINTRGEIFYSFDAITWKKSTATATGTGGCAYNGEIFVMVGSSGVSCYSGVIKATGANILADEESGEIIPYSVGNENQPVYFKDGKPVAGTEQVVEIIEYGTPPGEWTVGETASGVTRIAYGDETFVAVGTSGRIYYSEDNGRTWTLGTVPEASGVFYGITYGNGIFVATGGNSTGGTGMAYYSTDGKTWTAGTGIEHYLEGAAYGNGMFVAVGDFVTYYSTDGKVWTLGAEIENTYLYYVTYGNGTFVTIGSISGEIGSIAIYYSTDGKTWTAGTGITVSPIDLTYGNEIFVVVCNSGATYYSADNGKTWTAGTGIEIETNITIVGVTYGNGVFVATGGNSNKGIGGCAYYSEDGKTWTAGTGADGNLERVAYGNGVFVTTGKSGKMYYSSVTNPKTLPELSELLSRLNNLTAAEEASF